MSRFLRAAMVLLCLASCGGGGNYSAPRQLDDACAIIRERPQYLRAMERTERRWGIPVHVQMATIYQESKFIGNARTPLFLCAGRDPDGAAKHGLWLQPGAERDLGGIPGQRGRAPGQARRYRGRDRFHGLVHGRIRPVPGHFQGRCRSAVPCLSRRPHRLCQRKAIWASPGWSTWRLRSARGQRCTAGSWPTAGRTERWADCPPYAPPCSVAAGFGFGGDVEKARAHLAALLHLAQDHRGLRRPGRR
jgi:hypothetical protein